MKKKEKTWSTSTTFDERRQTICDFYLAPSSIPGAGLGIFTMKDIPEGSVIGEPDINIIISEAFDIYYKKHPWKYFNSYWNAEYEHELMSCNGAQVSSFPMGILSQYEPNFNAYARDVVYAKPAEINRWNAGAGAFTYLRRHFLSTRDIKAGEEIYVDVGEDYVNRNIKDMPKRDKIEMIIKELMDLGETSGHFVENYKEYMETIKVVVGLYDEKSGLSLPTDNIHQLKEFDIKTNITDWVITNGQCFDTIVVKDSTIPTAGLGAFAKRSIQKNQIITSVPLLHIEDKELIKKQLFLNYCFNHPSSTLLLCPTTHAAYINHSPQPNAKIVWSQSKQFNNLSNKSLEEGVFNLKWAVLSFDVVATNYIDENQEIFIDYGDEWQNAWHYHVSHFLTKDSSYKYPTELNIDESDDIKTVYEEPYAPNIQTICSFSYNIDEQNIPDFPDELLYKQNDIIPQSNIQSIINTFALDGSIFNIPRHETYFWPCHVYNKQNNDNYIVRILQSPTEDVMYFTSQDIPLLLYNYPKTSIYFVDKMYASDQFLDGAFRFPIGIPDDMFPEKWRNLEEKAVCQDGICV